MWWLLRACLNCKPQSHLFIVSIQVCHNQPGHKCCYLMPLPWNARHGEGTGMCLCVGVCACMCLRHTVHNLLQPPVILSSAPVHAGSGAWLAATFGDATAFHDSTSLRLHGSITKIWTPLQDLIPFSVIFSSDSCSSCFFFLHSMWVARKPEGPTSKFPNLDLGLYLHHIFLKQ